MMPSNQPITPEFKTNKLKTAILYIRAHKAPFIIIVICVALLTSITTYYLLDKKPLSVTGQKSVSIDDTIDIADPFVPPEPNVDEKAQKLVSKIDWRKSVKINTNNPNEPIDYDPLSDGEIIEQIDENQVFDADSLQLPDGWSAQWSSDAPSVPAEERTFSDFPTAPDTFPIGTEVRFIKIKIGNKDGVMPMVQSSIVEPLSGVAMDQRTGYSPSEPILYKKKIYQVMMAVDVEVDNTKFTLDCYDLATYARCANYPTYISSVVGPLGSGTKDINTAMNMRIIIDDGSYNNANHEGRMYLPAQQGNNYGVACVDLDSNENCGFSSMGSSPAPTGTINPALISGFIQSGDRLYGHANDADRTNQTVVCFDLDLDGQGADGLCPEFTQFTNASVQTYDISKHSNAYQTFDMPVMSGTRLMWNVAYRHTATDIDIDAFEAGNPLLREQSDRGNVLTCFDVATRLPCARTDGLENAAGWTHPFGGQPSHTTTSGIERGFATFIWKKNISGNADLEDNAVCTIYGLSGFESALDPSVRCFEIGTGLFIPFTGEGTASPDGLLPASWLTVPWQSAGNVRTITSEDGHQKSYFPFFNTVDIQFNSPKRKGATICYDWTIQARCTDFSGGRVRYWHDINLGDSADVGYAYDGHCMWAGGTLNSIWSFDAATGEFPCRTSKTEVDVGLQNQRFYCDGVTRAFEWDRVRLAKTSMYDFEEFNVEVQDSSGAVLSQGDLKELGNLNISGIVFNNTANPDGATYGYKNLKIVVTPKVLNTSPWANEKKPIISALIKSDEVQYCYKTTVKRFCDIDAVNTISEAQLINSTDTLTTQQTKTVGVHQPDNEQCFRDLKPTVTPNKTSVSNNELITYTINVQNKANQDLLDGRGDIPNSNNPETAALEATIPAGMTFVSADYGGVQQGNKVVWTNQSYAAANTKAYNVILQAPSSATAMLDMGAPQKGKVYAATSQTPLTMQATVIYDEDYFPSDNTASDNSAIFSNTTIPANVAPTVSTSVSDPDVIAPASFTVDALASDSDGSITKIEISQNGEVAKTCTNVTSCTFNATGYTAGTYSFTSKAYDNASPSLSSTSSAKIVTVTNPPAVDPPAPTNSLPSVTLSIPDNSVDAPGKFTVDAQATDSDGSISKIEISENGKIVKTCTDGNTCKLEASSYAAGSYAYSAKAYDNALPPGTATSATQVVEVLATGTSGGGPSITNTESEAPSNRRSAIGSITSIPSYVGEALGAALDTTVEAVEPVPPAVARAVPYTTIALIGLFAIYYFYQAYTQARSQRKIAELAHRFKKTKENRKNYINLTSHYIATPITTMSTTVELQESLKALPQKILKKAKLVLAKLSEDSKNLLNNSQLLSEESTQTAQTLDTYTKKNIFKNPRFVAPLVGVLLVVLLSNIVFVRADKYSASAVTIFLQTSFFALAVVVLVSGYNTMRKQKYVMALADNEFKLEKEIDRSQSEFIANTSAMLSQDVADIDEFAPTVIKASHGDNFKSGLKSLKKAVSKLAYLDKLTTSAIKTHQAPVNLNEIAEEVFAIYRPIALQSQLNLKIDAEPNVMAAVGPQGFKYILISVLDNAIKFTHPGGDIKVTIKNLNKRYVSLRVEDTGAGIPKNKIDSIFAPFSRGTDTLKFDYEGLGLDLYMDKLISEQAGGTIAISSIEGAYTTVTVKLPKK